MALPGVRRLFQLVGRRAPVEQDVDAELAFHLEAEADRLAAAGMSRDEARAAAARRFGSLERTRAELVRIDRGARQRARRHDRLEALAQDAAGAWRGLRRQPGFAAVVVLTLGVGISANATMFGLVDRLLLTPPPGVVEADRVVRLQVTERNDDFSQTWTNESVAFRTYTDQLAAGGWFSDLAAYTTRQRMPLGRGAEAGTLRITIATASYFGLLGVQPAAGRFWMAEEDRPGAGQPVAVLAWRYAERTYGSAGAAIGRRLFLGSQWYEVIGVAPPGFHGVDLEAMEAWLPFHAAAADFVGRDNSWRENYGWQWVNVLGRLRPGVTRASASAEATRIQRAAMAGVRGFDHAAVTALVPLQGFERAGVPHAQEQVALWLASVAVIVLLIICANVANLLLARAGGRRREIAVRIALGVGRGRLVRQLFLESLILAVLAGSVALILTRWGSEVVRSTLVPGLDGSGPAVDLRVAAVTALAVLTTGFLTGLAPAVMATRPGLVSALRAGSSEGSAARSGLRSVLLAAQAGLSLVLLVGAGLFVRSLWQVARTDLGYQPANVIVAGMDLDLAGYNRPARWAWYDAVLPQVQALPGVAAASLGINSPFWTMNSTRFRLTDRDSTPRLPGGGPYYNGVTPDYFRTLGMRLVAGRGFLPSDVAGAANVMVVNQQLAESYWAGSSPLGKCVRVGADSLPCAEIVGVVANARISSIQESPAAMYYLPLAQADRPGLSGDRILFLRTSIPAAEVIPSLRRLLQGMAPNLPFADIRTFQSQIDPEIQPWRLGAVMFGLFGALALVVAAIGLYSVMSYTVQQRTREFGIRTALGAGPGRVVREVFLAGSRTLAVGMAVGLLAALVAGRWVAPLLYRTSPRDPVVLLVVVGVLGLAAGLAMVIPARRATRIDPLEALRAD